ncbi:hypothetical protein EON82_05660 [bacterium]|nr:MAG: hypothetical protein EON82_05660 [bacterium]
MPHRYLGFSFIGLALVSTAWGQKELSGTQQYPQFRGLSGLPGGGFGVGRDGRPSSLGAAALATPIGYTMGRSSYAAGFFNTGENSNPFGSDIGNEGETNHGNGSLFGMAGFSYRGYRLTVGGMVLSTAGDSEMNLQFSPPTMGRFGVAVGVQDVFDVAGASGEGIDLRESHSSRSFYLVGTYEVARGTFVSLGKGERRFQGVFGNVSLPVTDRLRALVEYDSFNFNGGLLYNTGRIGRKVGDKSLECNLFLGTVRGKYGTAGVSLTF